MIGRAPDYRILWTWDYCTFWDDSNSVRGWGSSGENKRRGYFLNDYMRVVDFSAEMGFNGIVIWGALRAHDDGVDQFRSLVQYGKQKGVKILPGVGVFAYGGVFYDPRENIRLVSEQSAANPRSLQSWLNEHPELAAVGSDGKPIATGMFGAVACPSKKANLDWFKRSFQWLCEEFDIEGAQIEVGDYAICHCDSCNRRRHGSSGSEVFAVEDMIEPYYAASEIAGRENPNAWILCETYSSFATPKTGDSPGTFGSTVDEEQKKLLEALPPGAILQWVLDRAVDHAPTQDWDQQVSLPSGNNIARIHHGSQHPANGIDEWAVHAIGDLVRKARASGVNGVSIFGEESPASPPNEANYLVFSEFSGQGNPNPECDLKVFYANTLDPLYGGAGMAEEWKRLYLRAHTMRLDMRRLGRVRNDPLWFHNNHLEIGDVGLLDQFSRLTSSEKSFEMARLAQEARSLSAGMSGDICRRWAWLENWIWRAEFLHRTSTAPEEDALIRSK